jgi:hypothetical protein
MKVQLIPYQRPVPNILMCSTTHEELKNTKKRKPMATTKAKLTATNVEDITKKPPSVQRLWKLLSKMDPDGDLWIDNKGIIAFAGSTAKDAPERTAKALKLDEDDTELVSSFAIYDGPEPDSQDLATGLIFTVYQLVEIAFAMGVQFESERVTKAIAAAATKPGDDDDEFDEDSEDEEMEELSEEEEDSDDDDEDDE